MASDKSNRWHIVPLGWIIGVFILAFCAGIVCAFRSQWWIFLAICAIYCGILTLRGIDRINARMRYIVDATLSGDFSYKFPTKDVGRDERANNEMLNSIVEHFERLTKEVR